MNYTMQAPWSGTFLPRVRLSGAVQGPRIQGVRLGQTAQEWMRRAQDALAKYDALSARARNIANVTERNNILNWLGRPADPTSPSYRYATVRSDLTTDVAREGVGAYNVERRQNRVEELEAIDREFEARVKNAEAVYGTVPGPQVIREVSAAPDLTLPIAVGAGAVVLAILATQVL